jgi:hypothetical protein
MDDGCVDRRFYERKGLRYWQRGERCGHRRTCQGDGGADRAKIIRMLIRIVTRRRQLPGKLDRWRGLRRKSMGVAEPKRELNGQREQRQPCSVPDIRPKPLHPDNASLRGSGSPRNGRIL